MSSTACSASRLACSEALATASCSFISASAAFFGATSFATLEYVSMAWVHMHRDLWAERAEAQMVGTFKLLLFCS